MKMRSSSFTASIAAAPTFSSRPRRLLTSLAAALLLASCTSGPFAEEEARPERIPIDGEALDDEEAPALTSVPTEAPSVTPLEERLALQQQLREDRATAQAEVAAQQAEAAAGPEGQLAAIIQFAYGSASLDDRDQEILEQVARAQKERGQRLLVVGHSSAGSEEVENQAEANLMMSQRRANAVAEGLRAAGVAPEDLHIQALGDRDLQYQETGPTGEAGNRRVEIFLMQESAVSSDRG